MRVRILEDIKLWETSVVVFPMNPQATIERVKSLAGDLPEAARKELVEELVGHTEAGKVPIYVVSDAGDGSDIDEQSEHTSTPTSGGGADAAHAEADTGAPAPAGTSGWDRWSSEAVLAGRDPSAMATPAQRAGAAERLRLADEAMASRKTDADGKPADVVAEVRDFLNAERNR